MRDSGVEPAAGATPERRDPTGVPGLDEVLGGGLPRGTLVLVIGLPGSGKTTLAAQMAFSAAQASRSVLILSVLSEAPLKLIAHLRTYHFFAEHLVGTVIQVNALAAYMAEGAETAVARLADEVRRQRASLVVLDGFSGVRGALGLAQEARAFMYDLSGRLGMLGVTTVITSAAPPRQGIEMAEATNADVLLALHNRLEGVHGQRALDVIKVRGAAALTGRHSVVLDAAGARVYPRLEARVARAAADTAPPEPRGGGRAAFALPALDALLEGGLTSGTSTLLVGSAGVGKTLLGLYFALAGVDVGQPAVLLGFHEALEELQAKATPFVIGSRMRAAVQPEGGLTLLRQPSVECNADVLAADLLAAVDRTGARRVIIDSIAELERAVTETSAAARIPGFMAALLEALRLRGVTTLLIRETGVLAAAGLMQQTELVSLLAANVLWLQQITLRGRLYRVLSVPKMRYSAHDVTLREYMIAAPEGLRVLELIDSTAAVLTGIAHQQRQPGPLEEEAASP